MQAGSGFLRRLKEALAVPWVPVLLLGVLGAVLLGRAYWRLYRSTAIPVVRVFILIGYLLVALLLLDVTAALWQVQEPSEVIRALRWLLPYESLAFALVALMGIVWVVKGFLPRPRENEGRVSCGPLSRAGGKGRMPHLDDMPITLAKRLVVWCNKSPTISCIANCTGKDIR